MCRDAERARARAGAAAGAAAAQPHARKRSLRLWRPPPCAGRANDVRASWRAAPAGARCSALVYSRLLPAAGGQCKCLYGLLAVSCAGNHSIQGGPILSSWHVICWAGTLDRDFSTLYLDMSNGNIVFCHTSAFPLERSVGTIIRRVLATITPPQVGLA